MANLDPSKLALAPFREERNDIPTKLFSSITEKRVVKDGDIGYACSAPDAGKKLKVQESGDVTFQKLKGFFEVVQQQHPESRLELQQVNGNWRVWCGVCKKLLRPDKSGKAIHNIQRQHFSSARHNRKLFQMLQTEAEVESKEQNSPEKGSTTCDDGCHDRPDQALIPCKLEVN
ncbi:hypothetical protein KP509_05G075300 [Ceratopteris richardii]|uniref:Uncharacterized protein n=1 Tax=Ceratopteris richardii TaxID=49495 RepID=A0A8T2UMY9_CERRI|nr:hypothetical protein KP509_1Z306400 [Ceratopteris richardii]KAH7437506.1 hypothetical protein KP509_05G075300 [Ceratopteris richardii]KAH7437507.1 hypothetical protein KP509_05G075300 [Ceratopteris richardii]